MLADNTERNKVEEAKKQAYRYLGLKYGEIQKSELSENEKEVQIRNLFGRINKIERTLRGARNLAELSEEDKEELGIREESEIVVDENVVNALVSLYAKRAKIPYIKNRVIGLTETMFLGATGKLEEIDTTEFEQELRQYFTRHYADLLSEGYNRFFSEITKVPGFVNKEYGDLAQIAMKHNIEPERLGYFGISLTVQDGLVAEEDYSSGRCMPIFLTPEGINKRIFDLYSKALYREEFEGRNIFIDQIRKMKEEYITYAEIVGIEIKNPETLRNNISALEDSKRSFKGRKESLGELDAQLTSLQEKEQQAKELCNQYEQQLPDQSHQEI